MHNNAWSLFAQGMDFTTDKLRSLVRKWQTLIEAHVEVKTTDGYMLRMFCIGFTKKRAGQVNTVPWHIEQKQLCISACSQECCHLLLAQGQMHIAQTTEN